MVNQVMELHPDVPYFHIGCDEVYYKLTNEKCRKPINLFDNDFTEAFMRYKICLMALLLTIFFIQVI